MASGVTIAVRERIEVDGYSAWSVKEGVHSVHPPASVVQRMISVRVHLDRCDEQNGALRVIPGSHGAGRLTAAERTELLAQSMEVTCAFEAGGALVMRPLLMHASSPSQSPSHRRVVHLDFAVGSLEGGLEWSERA